MAGELKKAAKFKNLFTGSHRVPSVSSTAASSAGASPFPLPVDTRNAFFAILAARLESLPWLIAAFTAEVGEVIEPVVFR